MSPIEYQFQCETRMPLTTLSLWQVPDGQQQIIYFTESAVDSAHQAANTVIDKLVEKYHQRRLDNLKIEHEAILQLYKDQLLLSQRETQSKVEADTEKSAFDRAEHDARLRWVWLLGCHGLQSPIKNSPIKIVFKMMCP